MKGFSIILYFCYFDAKVLFFLILAKQLSKKDYPIWIIAKYSLAKCLPKEITLLEEMALPTICFMPLRCVFAEFSVD